MLTSSRLKSLLDYDPDTGVFFWKRGKIAGTPDKDGYIQIQIDGKIYKAHRLAFLFQNGSFPTGQVDHKNMEPADNRFCNLRNATPSENRANEKGWRLGLKGVWLCRCTNRFRAAVQKHGRRIDLGRFDTEQEAHEAYVNKAKELFGEFARAA